MADSMDDLYGRLHIIEKQLKDLSNISRRHNIRIRGLLESSGEGSRLQLIYKLLCPLLPDIPEEKWSIERAHRVLRDRQCSKGRHSSVPPLCYSGDNHLEMLQHGSQKQSYRVADLSGFGSVHPTKAQGLEAGIRHPAHP
ncbi:Hypothetical predicted protein [Pelobates cultripes]|uniref:Uncharacterized protein n=1 Tax=Pelobates cultripes TaxID=61616 RepID=A0AAD1R2X5_PELCU|nr:Hypothetical predicted protein [Pelobates cultripes]